MIDIQKLMALAPKLPERTPAEIQRAIESQAGDIWQITICPTCGLSNWGWRLGCSDRNCIGFTHGSQAWRWQANDGPLNGSTSRVLEHGKDFSFVDERPAGC